jgi:hypothetical protein
MRSHHVIAIAAVLVLGVGVKMFFFPNRPAEAQPQGLTNARMDIFQMHLDYPHAKDLPEQRVDSLF